MIGTVYDKYEILNAEHKLLQQVADEIAFGTPKDITEQYIVGVVTMTDAVLRLMDDNEKAIDNDEF